MSFYKEGARAPFFEMLPYRHNSEIKNANNNEEAVNNIISLFENLRQKENFGDVLTAHSKKNEYNFPVQDNKNIDIMMETGTGKTFTFIKTIFELSKNFGYKKFIVLIPTVPIRKGTKTN